MNQNNIDTASKGELISFPDRRIRRIPTEIYRDPRVRWTLDDDAMILEGELFGDVDPRLVLAAAGGGEATQPDGAASETWQAEAPEWGLTIRLRPAPAGERPPARELTPMVAQVFTFTGGSDDVGARADKNERRRRSRVARAATAAGFRFVASVTSTRSHIAAGEEHDLYILDLDLLAAAHVMRHLERRADRVAADLARVGGIQ